MHIFDNNCSVKEINSKITCVSKLHNPL